MGPLEFIYYLGYSLKKTYSLKHQKKPPFKVISVGNITVGGTGKTPAVIAIAEESLKRGLCPVILTRGYRGNAKGPCFVSRGNGPLLSVEEAGDEPFLMAEILRDTLIVKCGDRYEGGMFAIKELSLQPTVPTVGAQAAEPPSALRPQPLLFILDDGFQHWRLYRDIDLLLIDSTNPFGNRRLLPFGILREPLKEIARADLIVLTKTNISGQISTPEALPETLPETLIGEIGKYNKDAPLFLSEHKPVCLRTFSGRDLPLDVLSGESVVGFCGIGNPASFKNTLLNANAKVKEFITFRDHFKYDRKDIDMVKTAATKHGADWIVTTEKDIIRLRNFELPENLVSLGIKFSIDDKFYDKLFMEI